MLDLCIVCREGEGRNRTGHSGCRVEEVVMSHEHDCGDSQYLPSVLTVFANRSYFLRLYIRGTVWWEHRSTKTIRSLTLFVSHIHMSSGQRQDG